MDLALIETGSGGDLKINGNDFAIQNSWGNMIYIALFGGNIEKSTSKRIPAEQAFDYWANTALFSEEQSNQLNSDTERTLRDVPLNSAGRISIQTAVEKDLKFMSAFAKVTVNVVISGVDKVNITIKIFPLPESSGTVPGQFTAVIFVWDASVQEIGDFRIQDFNDDFFVG